jgi:hypothetical protein
MSVGEFRKTRHPRNFEFNGVLEICFSRAGNSRFSGVRDLRSFRFANMRISGILNRWRLRVMNTWKPETSSWRRHELRKTANSGICLNSGSEVMRGEIHESAEKQSQSCRPKKSGFWVWTGGRLVNLLDEKDILVCVHIRNTLWVRVRFRNVKVPSSPYKRGARARVNGLRFLELVPSTGTFNVSLHPYTVFQRVKNSHSLMLGESFEFFG